MIFFACCGRLGRRLAEQRQHFRHVRDVLVAQFFRGVVLLRVVIAVRHSEPALVRLRDHHRAVLVVLAGGEAEERVDARSCAGARSPSAHPCDP